MKMCFIVVCFALAGQAGQVYGAQVSTVDGQAQRSRATRAETGQAKASQPRVPEKKEKSKSDERSKAGSKPQTGAVPQENALWLPFLRNVLRDQKAIWTSPNRLRFRDTGWLVPLAGATAGLMVTDRDVSRHFSNSPVTLKRYRRLSDAGALSLVGAAGGLYLWGKATQDEHKRETGLLSGEALVNSLMLSSAIQYSTGRQRPYQNGAEGNFFRHGTSFPSNHSAAAWAVASVIAHEYPGPLTKFLVYGIASAVSMSRVRSKQHFPSDVLVGSLIGWFVGKQVYRAHHDPMLGGGVWEDFTDAKAEVVESHQPMENLGSPYVPLGSWVYPAIERLAALRYISSDFRGMRPWTRTECARLTDEAGEQMKEKILSERMPSDEAAKLQKALESEFAEELNGSGGGRNRSLKVESVYARALSLSGPVLNDSYHFGQTVANDYGRPSRRGTNVVTGASFSASYGPFFAYAWGEYQHAPSGPALSASVRNLIAQMDILPVKAAVPFDPINRFRLLDTYVGVNVKSWQISFGRQSLWWGTSESGPLLLSNNAEPINMLRINRVVPFRLPWISRFLGPMRVDFFVGRLGGHEVAARPWLQGQRISFKPSRRFEFGATHTATFGGAGRPNGAGVFFKSLFPIFELQRERSGGQSLSDQHLSFDFQYRLSHYATWYSEFLGSDDPYPFNAPTRMAVNTGVYFPHLPWLEKMDLRLEGVYTNSPCEPHCAAKTDPASFLHYWHSTYKNGYTNNGFILGNSIGRDGRGYQAWTTYWFSTTNKLQFGFKHTEVSNFFVPNGAKWNDFSVRYERDLKAGMYVRSSLQAESLRYPALFPQQRTNVGVSIEFGYAREMPR
jgi:hypothetical protein